MWGNVKRVGWVGEERKEEVERTEMLDNKYPHVFQGLLCTNNSFFFPITPPSLLTWGIISSSNQKAGEKKEKKGNCIIFSKQTWNQVMCLFALSYIERLNVRVFGCFPCIVPEVP